MSNNLLNNTTSLQNILEALQNKATPSNGVDTSDATAVAEDIMLDKTAYVKGEKITGAFTLEEELNTQDDLITQLQNVVNSLPDAGSAGGNSSLTEKTLLNLQCPDLTNVYACYTLNHTLILTEGILSNLIEMDRGTILILDDGYIFSIDDTQGCSAMRIGGLCMVYSNEANATLIMKE